ncbi:MAG: hypothetical protein ACI82S_001746 [Patiriisocius sp.]|jgi:hypothetical protein
MKNTNIYAGYRYPPQIISYAVWLYHRFALSLCDIEELLGARGITFWGLSISMVMKLTFWFRNAKHKHAAKLFSKSY